LEEAIMSSPIHRHAKGVDAALMYAPPSAREEARRLPKLPIAPTLEWPPRSRGNGNASPPLGGAPPTPQPQPRLSLDPHRIPKPPVGGAQPLGPIALQICAAVGLAALVAATIVSFPGTRQATTAPVQAGLPTTAIPVPTSKQDRLLSTPPMLQDEAAEAKAPLPLWTPQSEEPRIVAAASRSQSHPLPLDSEEVAALVKRGEDFLNDGDLASARLLLRRAAEAASAHAALALGATFDPLVIKQIGAVGAEPDPVRAREWYQKAAELGSAEAPQRLEQLASQLNAPR
jgi:hypothetical protein